MSITLIVAGAGLFFGLLGWINSMTKEDYRGCTLTGDDLCQQIRWIQKDVADIRQMINDKK